MSSVPDSPPPPPVSPPPGRPPHRHSPLAGGLFGMSCLVNVLFLVLVVAACSGVYLLGSGDSLSVPLSEHHYAGKARAADKIAVVSIDGLLMEGLLGFADKQIDRA